MVAKHRNVRNTIKHNTDQKEIQEYMQSKINNIRNLIEDRQL